MSKQEEHTIFHDLTEETSVNSYEVVKQNKRGLIFDMLLIEAEKPNNNRRIYDRTVLDNAMKQYDYTYISKRHSFMEVMHPMDVGGDFKTRFQFAVIQNSCARINRYWWEGNKMYGEVETLLNTSGKEFAELIQQEGFVIACSLRARALGIIKASNDGSPTRIDVPIVIFGFDMVLNPSFSSAVKIGDIRRVVNNAVDTKDKSALTESKIQLVNYTDLSETTEINDDTVIVCDAGSCCLTESTIVDDKSEESTIDDLFESTYSDFWMKSV